MKGFLCFVGLLAVFQQALAADFTISLDGVTQVPITIVSNLPTLPASDDAVTPCQSNCSNMISTINNCVGGANDQSCFCTQDLLNTMNTCEQCMFNFLVGKNIKAPSPVVGSNPALAGLFGACTANNSHPELKAAPLILAPNWTGPVGIQLNLGETIITVGTGALMGMAAIYILFTIS